MRFAVGRYQKLSWELEQRVKDRDAKLNLNFTRFQIKLLILLDTTHLCSHNISLNFILDVDVGSGFSPNQRRQIHT
jgi:hypothetical protein